MVVIRPKLEGVSLALVVSFIFLLMVFLLSRKSMELLEKEIKHGLVSGVSAAATTIDGDLHKTFSLNTSRDDPIYIKTIAPLEDIRQASLNIRYIYTCIMVGDKVHFVLNPSPQNDANNNGIADELPPALMDDYDDPAEELVQALKEGIVTVTEKPYKDKWGTFYSAYAPFYDKDNNLVGVLGMDLELKGFHERLFPLKLLFEKTFIISAFMGLIVGVIAYIVRRSSKNLLLTIEDMSKVRSSLERFYFCRVREMVGICDHVLLSRDLGADLREKIDASKTYFKSFLLNEEDDAVISMDDFLERLNSEVACPNSPIVVDSKGVMLSRYFVKQGIVREFMAFVNKIQFHDDSVHQEAINLRVIHEYPKDVLIEIVCESDVSLLSLPEDQETGEEDNLDFSLDRSKLQYHMNMLVKYGCRVVVSPDAGRCSIVTSFHLSKG